MADIVITIAPDGSTKVHAEGIQGSSCTLHTLPYVNAIGIRVGEEALPEMFALPSEAEQEQRL